MWGKMPADLQFAQREALGGTFWPPRRIFERGLRLGDGAFGLIGGTPTAEGKEQIQQFGLEPFIQRCKESLRKNEGVWQDSYGADRGRPHEACQAVKGKSAVVKCKAKGEDAYFLACTDAPWTLPHNVALCVDPDECYVRARSGGEVYYLAEALAPAVLGADYEVLYCMLGKELEHRQYEPPFAGPQPSKRCRSILCGGHGARREGTGIVHLAPAFCGDGDALPVLEDLKARGLLYAAPEPGHGCRPCRRYDTSPLHCAPETRPMRVSGVRGPLSRGNNVVWLAKSSGHGAAQTRTIPLGCGGKAGGRKPGRRIPALHYRAACPEGSPARRGGRARACPPPWPWSRGREGPSLPLRRV